MGNENKREDGDEKEEEERKIREEEERKIREEEDQDFQIWNKKDDSANKPKITKKRIEIMINQERDQFYHIVIQ